MKKHKFKLSIVDTDSIAISKPNGKEFSEEERLKLLKEINSNVKSGIEWCDDDTFTKVVVVAAKNYVLQHCTDPKCGECKGKPKIKGSGLKATKKEPKLKEFSNKVIEYILKDKVKDIPKLYMEYVKLILKINKKSNIADFCFKATATKSVLDPKTAFNTKIRDALLDNKIDIVEGDKYYFYFKPGVVKEVTNTKGKKVKKNVQALGVREKFNGVICHKTLLKKLFVTLKMFSKHGIIDIKEIPNLTLKRYEGLLASFSKL